MINALRAALLWLLLAPAYATEFNAANYSTLQAAVDAAAGHSLRIPAGTWDAANLSLPSNIRIFGEGRGLTKLRLPNGANVNPVICSGKSYISISDLTIDGNRANNSAGNNLWLNNCSRVWAERLELVECPGSGFLTENFGALIYLDDVMVVNCNGHGINYSETSSSILTRITASNTGLSGINLAAGGNIVIGDSHFGLPALSNSGYAALRIAGTSTVTVSNFRSSNYSRGLFILSGAKDVNVDTFISNASGAEAVLIQSTVNGVTSDVTLANFRIKNPGQLAASGSRDGVRVDGVARTSIGLGSITDSTGKMEYGLRTTDNSYGQATDFIESDNRINGATIAPKSLAH